MSIDHERWEFTGFVAGIQPVDLDGVVVIVRFSDAKTKSVVVKMTERDELNRVKAIDRGTPVHVIGQATVRSYIRASDGKAMSQLICLATEVNTIVNAA